MLYWFVVAVLTYLMEPWKSTEKSRTGKVFVLDFALRWVGCGVSDAVLCMFVLTAHGRNLPWTLQYKIYPVLPPGSWRPNSGPSQSAVAGAFSGHTVNTHCGYLFLKVHASPAGISTILWSKLAHPHARE